MVVPEGGTGQATTRTLGIMAGSGVYYNYGSMLGQVTEKDVAVLDEHSLSYGLDQLIQYERHSKKKNISDIRRLDPPVPMLRQLLSLGENRTLPNLRAIVDVPVIRDSGEVVCTPGYDEVSQLLLRPAVAEFAGVPVRPNRELIETALSVIMQPIAEFPFVDAASRTAAFCALMTAVLRPTIPTAPMFVFDSPVVGAGKTLLAGAVGALRLGQPAAVLPAVDCDESEMRKRILANLIEGSGVFAIDNASGHQRSNALAALLTSSIWSDRVLGQSKLRAALPARSLVTMTGINVTFNDDLARRHLICRLEPPLRQAARHFDFNPIALILQHRKHLIISAVTLIRARMATHPGVIGRLASFEDWDHRIGRTAAWIGAEFYPQQFVDPNDMVSAYGATTSDTEDTLLLLDALTSAFRDQWFAARDVARLLDEGHPDLQLAMRDITDVRGTTSTKKIGWHLVRSVDRAVGGSRLRSKSGGQYRSWRVEKLDTVVTS